MVERQLETFAHTACEEAADCLHQATMARLPSYSHHRLGPNLLETAYLEMVGQMT